MTKKIYLVPGPYISHYFLYPWESSVWHFKNFVNQKFEQKIYWFKCLLLQRVKLSFSG